MPADATTVMELRERAAHGPTSAEALRALVEAGTHLASTLRDEAPLLAREAAETAHDALQALDPADWGLGAVECLYTTADLRYRTGSCTDAPGPLLEAIELCEQPDAPVQPGPDLAHRLRARLSTVYSQLGLHALALSESYAALAIAEGADDPTALCWTWSTIAVVRLDLGDTAAAAEAADRAIAHGLRPGCEPQRLALAHLHATLAAGRSHRFADAERHARDAVAAAGALNSGDRASLAITLGELAMRQGDPAGAVEQFEAAIALVESTGEQLQLSAALAGLAGARLSLGDPAGACDLAGRALAVGDAHLPLTARCQRLLAASHEAMGHLEDALRWQKRHQRTEREIQRAQADERIRLLSLDHRVAAAERQAEADRSRAERAEAERQLSAERYRSMIEGAADLVAVIDEDTTIRWVSQACTRILGLAPEELVGTRPFDGIEHEDLSVPARAFLQAVEQPGIPSTPVEYRIRHSNGTWRHVSAVITDLRHDPSVEGLMFVATDTTQHRWNEAIVRSQANVLDLITRGAPLPEVLRRIVDTVHDLCSPSLRCHLSWSGDIPPGSEPGAGFEVGDDVGSWWAQTLSDAAGRRVADLIVEQRGGHRSTPEESRVLEQALQLARIAVDRSTASESMAHQATHDFLTGLPNRLRFEQLAGEALARRVPDGPPLAVLFLDLDRFKLVNDSLGHGVGDQLLVQVTDRLRRCLDPGDVAARFGGDEFTLLRPAVADPADLGRLASRVIEAIREPFRLDDVEVCLSVSIGITVCRRPDAEPGGLITEADSAMFRAKELGRDRAELFDEGMRVDADDRLRRGSALRQALARDEMSLAYQPLVDLRNGRVVGYEALLRWCSPDLGDVTPTEFVPLAEETGIIVPIGTWSIRRVCEELAALDDPLPVWINLSANQLSHPALLASVDRSVAETGIDPALLCFEITETTIGTDLATAVDRISRLRAAGARIAIDDFGTGYSSLDRLQSIPVNVLKIDQSFITGVDGSLPRQALLGAILDLCGSLGMTSVAEGVETAGELACLLDSDCEVAQGYLFARPGPMPDTPARFDLRELLDPAR